jgi:hypothetical protein
MKMDTDEIINKQIKRAKVLKYFEKTTPSLTLI